MNDPSALLFTGLLFSSIGMGYLVYGKRQKHKIAFYTGIGLIVYPYFVSSVPVLIALGIGLMLVPRFVNPD